MNNRQFWFPVPGNFYLDEEMVALGPVAQLLLLKVIAMCATLQTGGRVTGAQLKELSTNMAGKPARVVEALIANGSLREDKRGTEAGTGPDEYETDPELMLDPFDPDSYIPETHSGQGKTNPGQGQDRGGPFSRDYVLTHHRKWIEDYADGKRKPAGQARPEGDVPDPSQPRARGRGPARETHKQTHTSVTSRPATPDGRDVTGQERVAPRSAEGAAQRAPGEGPGKYGSWPGQYRGPVRVAPDFQGPRNPQPEPVPDSLAKSRAIAQLKQFADERGIEFEPMVNGKTTAIREDFPVWEVESNGSRGEDDAE